MNKESYHVSRFELLMDAGFGAQKAGDILIRAFAKIGKYVYIEPMIPAEISPPPRSKPALSGVIIRVADFDLTNIGNNTDLILAAHEVVLDRRLDDEENNERCRILLDMSDQAANPESYERVLKRVTKLGLKTMPISVMPEAAALIKSLGGKGKNMYYLGILAAIYNMPTELLEKEIRSTFQKKLSEEVLAQNVKLFDLGYDYARQNLDFSLEITSHRPEGEKLLIDGNTALSLGIIDAGIKLYSGYPITPASSIMHTLARAMPHYGGIVHQAEDEIAALGTAIGSYFGGVPAATGTSGPGISLKQEFIGYASMAEVPVIIIDAQRGGPSTGMPTKTEQSDLGAVIFGCHGDNVKVVVSVANVIDCFYAPSIARYLAEKLRLPVFIMTDFQTANSYKVIEKPRTTAIDSIDQIPDFVFERFRLQRLPDEIPMVRKNQSVPGTPHQMRRITGLNTDEEGRVNYFAGSNQRAHAARNAKLHAVRRALTVPEMFGPPEGDVLIVGWGSTRGAIEEAVNNLNKDGIKASGLQFKIVYPLPLMLKEIFERFRYVVTVELTYGDEFKAPPLMMLLRNETLVDVHSLTCAATGRPIRPDKIYQKTRQLITTGKI